MTLNAISRSEIRLLAKFANRKELQLDKLSDKHKNSGTGPKDWRRTLKGFIKPSKTTSVPPLNVDGKIYSDNKDKSNLLNIFTEQTILDNSTTSLPQFIPRVDSKLETITLIPYEVEAILSSLQVGKAAEPDHINNRLLKELSHSLSFPLCELFNFSLASGKMPSLWKLAHVTPIRKRMTHQMY